MEPCTFCQGEIDSEDMEELSMIRFRAPLCSPCFRHAKKYGFTGDRREQLLTDFLEVQQEVERGLGLLVSEPVFKGFTERQQAIEERLSE